MRRTQEGMQGGDALILDQIARVGLTWVWVQVVQQLMQQRMYGEVQELRDMIEMLELPLRGEGTLTQTKLESVIEEAQGLIAKLLTYGQH